MSVTLAYGIPAAQEGLQVRLGIARGFFREEGIDLALKIVFGGPEIARAYDAGVLKIGELGSPPATTAIAAARASRSSPAAFDAGPCNTLSPLLRFAIGAIFAEKQLRRFRSAVAATGSRARCCSIMGSIPTLT
jgi:hypothetical protein